MLLQGYDHLFVELEGSQPIAAGWKYLASCLISL